jgi:hypothetical protein
MHRMEEPMSSVISLAKALAGLLLLATPALAVDGEILIDQAKVNAGGITPGDAPGFPATLRRPGRYKLAGNLRVPAGQIGIEVTQHNVTIDLNGFTISSNPPGEASVGVFAVDVAGLRAMNGTITGFRSFGVDITSVNGLVENLRIVRSGIGVLMRDGRIRNSTIVNNSFRGIRCSSCLVEQNVVTGNGSGVGGGAVDVADGAAVIGNVIVSNEGVGLWSTGGIAKFSGYGNNVLFGNNGGSAQVGGNLTQLHANVCDPACP